MTRDNNAENSRPRDAFARYAVDTLYDAIGGNPVDSRRELRRKHSAAFSRVGDQGMQADDTVESIDYSSNEEAINLARRVFVEGSQGTKAEYDAHLDWAQRRGTTWMNPVTALLDKHNEDGSQMYLHVIASKRMDPDQRGLENLKLQLALMQPSQAITPWPSSGENHCVEIANPEVNLLDPANMGTVLDAFNSDQGDHLEENYTALRMQMADKGFDGNLPRNLRGVLAMSHFGENLAQGLMQNGTGQIDLYYPLHEVGINYFPPEVKKNRGEKSRVPLAIAGTVALAGLVGGGIAYQDEIKEFWAHKNKADKRIEAPVQDVREETNTPSETHYKPLEVKGVITEPEVHVNTTERDSVADTREDLQSCEDPLPQPDVEDEIVDPYEGEVATGGPSELDEFYMNGIFPSRESNGVREKDLKKQAAERDLVFDLMLTPELDYIDCPDFMKVKAAQTQCRILNASDFKKPVKDERGRLVLDAYGQEVKSADYTIFSDNPEKEIVRVAVKAEYFDPSFNSDNPEASIRRVDGYVQDEEYLKEGLKEDERVVVKGDLMNMLGFPGTVTEATLDVDLRGVDGEEERESYRFLIKR